jgi:DNA-binding response OmpR family regulator
MKPRVLIVDDEPDFLDLVEFNLSGQGFEIVRAASGLEALHKARCESPNVIVLDLMLPDLDGFAVGEILRSQPSTKDVPVVVLSALDRPVARHRSSRFSVTHWLKKGEDLTVLRDCILAALAEHQERVKLRLDAKDASENDQVANGRPARASKLNLPG